MHALGDEVVLELLDEVPAHRAGLSKVESRLYKGGGQRTGERVEETKGTLTKRHGARQRSTKGTWVS